MTALGRCCAFAVSAWACAVVAQTPATQSVPVEDRAGPGSTTTQQQQRTSAAYRALTQARYESKLAEQDYVNAEDAYRAAQQRADLLKENLEKSRKVREAARVKESAASKAYDNELNPSGAR